MDGGGALPTAPDPGHCPASMLWCRLILPLCIAGHWLLELVGNRQTDFWWAAAIHIAATAVWLLLCRALVRGDYRPRLVEVLALAILLRLLCLPLTPSLSDDIYRYMHEGQMVLAGENPYLSAPVAVAEDLRHPVYWEKINHPEVPAAYPPVQQYAMAGAVALIPSPLGQKLLFGICDLLVVLVLWYWLPLVRFPPERAFIYGACPLLALEFAGEGHSDSLGILLMMTALLIHGWGRKHLGAGVLALAAACKLMPAVLLPFMLRRAWAGLLLFALVLVGVYLPFVLDTLEQEPPRPLRDMFAGTLRYAEAWAFNGSVFSALQALMEYLAAVLEDLGGGRTWLSYHATQAAKVPIVVFGLGLLGWAWMRRWPLHKVAAGFFMFFVACTPTLHPWYLAWLVPFLCIYPNLGWLSFTGTIYLAYYVVPASPEALRWIQNIDDELGIKVSEYVPFYFGFFLLLRDASHGSATDKQDQQAA